MPGRIWDRRRRTYRRRSRRSTAGRRCQGRRVTWRRRCPSCWRWGSGPSSGGRRRDAMAPCGWAGLRFHPRASTSGGTYERADCLHRPIVLPTSRAAPRPMGRRNSQGISPWENIGSSSLGVLRSSGSSPVPPDSASLGAALRSLHLRRPTICARSQRCRRQKAAGGTHPGAGLES
jgi:hypothetical protein